MFSKDELDVIHDAMTSHKVALHGVVKEIAGNMCLTDFNLDRLAELKVEYRICDEIQRRLAPTRWQKQDAPASDAERKEPRQDAAD